MGVVKLIFKLTMDREDNNRSLLLSPLNLLSLRNRSNLLRNLKRLENASNRTSKENNSLKNASKLDLLLPLWISLMQLSRCHLLLLKTDMCRLLDNFARLWHFLTSPRLSPDNITRTSKNTAMTSPSRLIPKEKRPQ